MKKYFAIALLVLVAASFAACGCQRTMDESTGDTTTTAPNAESNVLPDVIPTMDTNIPDPSVDTEMPIYTENTDNTDNTNNSESMNPTGNGNMSGK